MTTPGGQSNNAWAGNKWLPTANKPGGSGLGIFGNRTKVGWGQSILDLFGDSAPKSQAISEGLFTNWLGEAGNPNDPLLQEKTSDSNLLTNGGFESGFGWDFPTGGSRDATVGRTAAGSAKIVCDGTVQTLTSESVPVVEGQLLLFGAWAKWASIVGAVEAVLVLQCFTGATLIVEQELAAFTPASNGGWQELQQTFTAPAACDHVQLLCEIQATSGTLWWDDVSVRKKLTDKVSEADGKATSAQDDILATIKGIINGWTSGSSSGAHAGVYTTMAQINLAIATGATVQEYTSNGTWTKPAGLTEFYVILIGSGETGGAGSGGPGGTGGRGGGFIALKINPADLPSSAAITIGTGGGTTKFGSLAESALDAGGLAGLLGFSSTTSLPGKGGNGGTGHNGNSGDPATAGTSGYASALGAGGTAGTAGVGGPAGSGGTAANVATSTETKSGAGGGGGGGGAYSVIGQRNGGAGGNGGFPGGGGGGGGGTTTGFFPNGTAGPGGSGGNGIMWTVHKATGV